MYFFIKIMANLFLLLFLRMKIYGKTKTSDDGLIICSNHMKAFDCVYLGVACRRKVHYMAKKELFENKFLAWFLSVLGAYPVDRGKGDLAAIRNSVDMLKSGKVIGIFPEGTRGKKTMEQSEIKDFKEGFALIAKLSKIPVQPVHIWYEKGFIFKKINIAFGDVIPHGELFPENNKNKDLNIPASLIVQRINQLRK